MSWAMKLISNNLNTLVKPNRGLYEFGGKAPCSCCGSAI